VDSGRIVRTSGKAVGFLGACLSLRVGGGGCMASFSLEESWF
jgi:hypothetical protein